MTALAEQLTALGKYPTTAIADLAITAGQVQRDANGQIRCAGCTTALQADIASNGQVAALTLLPSGTAQAAKGSGNNKW